MRGPAAFFEAVALPYEMLTRHPVWEEHCARMAALLPQGARLTLDVGCGPGNSTVRLPGIAIGGDPAPRMVRPARQRAPALPLVALDACALPIRSDAVDGVTFHSVLYLLADQGAALREAQRVLRRGGRVVLLEPQAGRRATILGLARALPSPRWALTAALWRTMSGVYGRPTAQSLWALLESAGLRVLGIEETLGGLGLLAVAEKA